jgi:hypothetical protein
MLQIGVVLVEEHRAEVSRLEPPRARPFIRDADHAGGEGPMAHRDDHVFSDTK